MSLNMLNKMNGKLCGCGKIHSFSARVIAGEGVLKRLPGVVKEYGAKKVFVLSDKNTYVAAGEQTYRDYMIENQIRSETMEAWYMDILASGTATLGNTSRLNKDITFSK